VLDDLADRLGRALGGDAGDAHSVLGAADVTAATEEDVRARDLGAVRLKRRTLQPNGGEMVLAAAVRATAGLDVDLLDERIVDSPLLDRLGDRPADALRGGDTHLAGVGARAGDGVRDQTRLGLAETDRVQLGVKRRERLLVHPAQYQVLVLLRAGVAAAELAHDSGEAAELFRRDVPERDGNGDRDEARLPLLDDVRLDPAVEPLAGANAIRRGAGRWAFRGELHERRHVERLPAPRLVELFLHQLLELVDTDLVEEELHAGLVHVLAREVLADRVAQHVAGVCREVRGDVEELVAVAGDAGVGAAGHVANGMAACLPCGEANVGEDLQDLGRPIEVHEVELEVLASGDVAAAVSRIVLSNDSHRLHLLRIDAAVRKLHTDHLVVHLPLAVYTHAQAERRELTLKALFVLPAEAC